MSRLSVVIATHNPGKVAELRSLLADLSVELLTISEVSPSFLPPVEDGATFEDNALIKARAAAAATQMVSIADDSGLEVDALLGKPGVRSARFAHEAATDAENNAALLTQLSDVEGGLRTARFRCVMAMVDPFAEDAKPVVVEGRCEGVIATSAKGESGFGYDPLFVVAGVGRTYAELTHEEKNTLSHRGKAARSLIPQLVALFEARMAEAGRVLAERE
jgi:XTP/dITP diphosphohydrolase